MAYNRTASPSVRNDGFTFERVDLEAVVTPLLSASGHYACAAVDLMNRMIAEAAANGVEVVLADHGEGEGDTEKLFIGAAHASSWVLFKLTDGVLTWARVTAAEALSPLPDDGRVEIKDIEGV